MLRTGREHADGHWRRPRAPGLALPGPKTKVISRRALLDARVEPAADQEDQTEVVSSGVPADETVVVIADPSTGLPCGEGVVGEVRVHSPSVATAYWNNQPATDDRFRPTSDNDSRVFLYTGDLGFMSGGELYVTGRLKDVLVLRGQNHYPQDIERTVRLAHPCTHESPGAAFLVEADLEPNHGARGTHGFRTSRLVVVQETPRSTSNAQREEALRAIRLAVASEHDLAVDEVVLIPPAILPRTSSGKVQRFRCREQLLAEELSPLARWRHQPKQFDRSVFPELKPLLSRPGAPTAVREQIAESLLTWLAKEGGSEPGAFDAYTSFAEFGIDSVGATELSRQMEEWIGQPLSPVLAWSYPNVDKLSVYLTGLLLPDQSEAHASDEGGEFDDLLSEIEDLDETDVQEKLHRMG